MRMVKVAATQMSCSDSIDENIEKADSMVRLASQGARIILNFRSFSRLCISVRRRNRNIMNMRLS